MKNLSRRQVCTSLPALGLLVAPPRFGLAQLITGASKVAPGAGTVRSNLEFESSNSKLVDVFLWAKGQATAYAFDSGDPAGAWHEAVEPGREGFCIRDTCHQALGAQALGLARFNLNMLRQFAANISDSKDWCSYWEIDRYGRPAPVDYKNDAEFWYNLPANFDLLDCCFRMYVWSGDLAYINDPVFLNFYDRTVNDYVERWGLDIDHIMKRPRLMNVRGILDEGKKFPRARGIPGYNEGDHTYVLGFDVVATQRAAYLAYAHIQQARQNAELADEFLKKAAAVDALLKHTWWNNTEHCFYARLNENRQMEGNSARRDDPNQGSNWRTDVRTAPDQFVRPGETDAAVERLLDLSHARLEYPEVSYTRVSDIVSTVMGVNLEYASPLLSAVDGNWVEVSVQTLSGLGTAIEWAQISNFPIRACQVTVRHDGARKTTFTNQRGPALIWRAMFDGQHPTLLVNGREAKASTEGDSGRMISSVRIAVGAGGNVSVSVPQ